MPSTKSEQSCKLSSEPSTTPSDQVEFSPSDVKNLPDTLFTTSLLLGGLALSSAVSLGVRWMMQARWTAIMNTAGFVDWSDLEYTKLHMISSACTITMCAVTKLAMPSPAVVHPKNHAKSAVSILKLMLPLGLTLATVWFSTIMCFLPMRIPEDTTLQLIGQVESVVNFNRGFCQAWCRGTDVSVSGDCASLEKSVFDEVVGTIDIAIWCGEAIKTQNFEPVAECVGVSPFASLKGEASRGFTATHEDLLKYSNFSSALCYCLLVSILVGLGAGLSRKDDNSPKNE